MNKRRTILLVVAGLALVFPLLYILVGLVGLSGDQRDFAVTSLIAGGFFAILILVVTWLLLRLQWFKPKKQDEYRCPECNYMMHGLTETKCPECGAAFTIDQLVNK